MSASVQSAIQLGKTLLFVAVTCCVDRSPSDQGSSLTTLDDSFWDPKDLETGSIDGELTVKEVLSGMKMLGKCVISGNEVFY